jgi:ribosome production factor 2
MHFASPLFETLPALVQFKSMLLDFFNGHELGEVHLAGLEHVISITAGPLPAQPAASSSSSSAVPVSEAAGLPTIHFRTSTIRLLHSGTRIPRMELTPMGPNFDFKLRRRQEADSVVLKEAMRRPKLEKKNVEKGLGKKRKNVETDDMGDKVGKLHLGKQELGKLQVRKMKGLRKFKSDRTADDAASEGGESSSTPDHRSAKKSRS